MCDLARRNASARLSRPLAIFLQVNVERWPVLELLMSLPDPIDPGAHDHGITLGAGAAEVRRTLGDTGIQENGPALGSPVASPEAAELPFPRITIVPGDASKDRFFAAWMDSAGATVLALVAAGWVPGTQVVLRTVALVAGYLAYFFLSEAAFASSPGKLVFGLWVRRLKGGPCSIWQAAVRTLARLVEVNPLLLGAIPAGVAILASTNRQRFGDMLAGTVVRKGRRV
jgi:uncharacterized RDD family membrane protein YckC